MANGQRPTTPTSPWLLPPEMAPQRHLKGQKSRYNAFDRWGTMPRASKCVFIWPWASLKRSKCSNGKARFITIIAAPPEHFKGFRRAHCRRKAYSLAWGIVPNQSNVYAPKIGHHMRRQGAISGGDSHGCGVGCIPPEGMVHAWVRQKVTPLTSS